MATFDEIKENDYNLNIPRYVDTFEEEEPIDMVHVGNDIKKIRQEQQVLEKNFWKLSLPCKQHLKMKRGCKVRWRCSNMSNDTQPEIRFPGFTDDWEERKLKDIFDIHTDFVSNGSFQALKDNVKLYKTENYAYMIRLQDASNNWSGPWLYTDKQGFDF